MPLLQCYQNSAFYIKCYYISTYKIKQDSRKYTFFFTLRGRLTIDHVRFKRNWIWDILEIDQRDVGMTINGNAINLPTSMVIPLRDKFRGRKLLRRQPLFFHVILKQGKHGLP